MNYEGTILDYAAALSVERKCTGATDTAEAFRLSHVADRYHIQPHHMASLDGAARSLVAAGVLVEEVPDLFGDGAIFALRGAIGPAQVTFLQ